MKEHFINQIQIYPTVVPQILDKIEFKTVWSGKRITVGDRILYAYVYPLNSNDIKAVTFLERELDELSNKFRFIKYYDDGTPIFVFKDDKLDRN